MNKCPCPAGLLICYFRCLSTCCSCRESPLGALGGPLRGAPRAESELVCGKGTMWDQPKPTKNFLQSGDEVRQGHGLRNSGLGEAGAPGPLQFHALSTLPSQQQTLTHSIPARQQECEHPGNHQLKAQCDGHGRDPKLCSPEKRRSCGLGL